MFTLSLFGPFQLRDELKFLKKIIRRYGIPERVETDLLRSYPAALQQIGT